MKKQDSKRSTIIALILIFAIIISSLGIMVIYDLNNDREGKFKKNHEAFETVGKFIKYETGTKSPDAVLEYYVNGKEHTMEGRPLMTMEIGDEFIVLYDKNDPDESIFLEDRPVIPDKDTNQVNGYVTYIKNWKFDTEIDFKYSVGANEYKRVQFFPLDKTNELLKLKKLYDSKNTVVVIFPNYNPRRGFIDLRKIDAN